MMLPVLYTDVLVCGDFGNVNTCNDGGVVAPVCPLRNSSRESVESSQFLLRKREIVEKRTMNDERQMLWVLLLVQCHHVSRPPTG